MELIPITAGLVSTAIFVMAGLPRLLKALRLRDMHSYSPLDLGLVLAGEAIYWVYVSSLPFGPVWLLQIFYTGVAVAMCTCYLRFQGLPHLPGRRRPSGSAPQAAQARDPVTHQPTPPPREDAIRQPREALTAAMTRAIQLAPAGGYRTPDQAWQAITRALGPQARVLPGMPAYLDRHQAAGAAARYVQAASSSGPADSPSQRRASPNRAFQVG